ncbi:hypothetical protein [Nocardia pseudovaccinii]|uniref:hypothetical protein n=1 Tax=Nocardia pseudovaccinii TaxID=189540 RepID=UPI0012F4F87D|nr:hypothetical protein [Nocardia pseudovaccinii]
MARTPYDVLYRIAREHRPIPSGTRCARCGLAYGSGLRECPTLRDIKRELACRGDIDTPPRETGRALCAGSSRWQVDTHSDRRDWNRAVGLCRKCPLLITCRRAAERAIADRAAPKSLIMGGLLFDSRGNIVPEDDFADFDRRRNGLAKRQRVRRSKHHEAA